MSKVIVVSAELIPRLKLNLVATTLIKGGETVLQCQTSEIEFYRTWRTVQIDHRQHIKNEFLDFVDHSCDPNCVFDIATLSLRAIKTIVPEQSITFFYPGSEVELAQDFLCHCGHADCLEHIKGGFYLTPMQMQWAMAKGYCTSFMQAQFSRLTATMLAQDCVSNF